MNDWKILAVVSLGLAMAIACGGGGDEENGDESPATYARQTVEARGETSPTQVAEEAEETTTPAPPEVEEEPLDDVLSADLTVLEEIALEGDAIGPGFFMEGEQHFSTEGEDSNTSFIRDFADEFDETFDLGVFVRMRRYALDLEEEGFTAGYIRDFGRNPDVGIDDMTITMMAFSTLGGAGNSFVTIDAETIEPICDGKDLQDFPVPGVRDSSVCDYPASSIGDEQRIMGAVHVDRFVAIVQIRGEPNPGRRQLAEKMLQDLAERMGQQ